MNLCTSSQGSCFRRTVPLYPNPKFRPPKGVCCIKQKEISLCTDSAKMDKHALCFIQ